MNLPATEPKFLDLTVRVLFIISSNVKRKVKVKCSRYWPSVAQRMGTGIALIFHDRGNRRG